jgi:hypothetical protein
LAVPQLAGDEVRGPTSVKSIQNVRFKPGEPVQVVLFSTQGFPPVGFPLGRVRQVLVEQLVSVSLQFPTDRGLGPAQRPGDLRLGFALLEKLVDPVPLLRS